MQCSRWKIFVNRNAINKIIKYWLHIIFFHLKLFHMYNKQVVFPFVMYSYHLFLTSVMWHWNFKAMIVFYHLQREELLGVAFNRIMRMEPSNGDHIKTWRYNTMKVCCYSKHATVHDEHYPFGHMARHLWCTSYKHFLVCNSSYILVLQYSLSSQ